MDYIGHGVAKSWTQLTFTFTFLKKRKAYFVSQGPPEKQNKYQIDTQIHRQIYTYIQMYSMHVKSLQSCPTLCDPMDCSLPGSSVHGILQARIPEQDAMPSLVYSIHTYIFQSVSPSVRAGEDQCPSSSGQSEKEPEFSSSPFCSIQAINKLDDVFPHWGQLSALLGLGIQELATQSWPPLYNHTLQPARLFCTWNSPGKNTGVGSHSLLQGIFLTQILNLVSCITGNSLPSELPERPLTQSIDSNTSLLQKHPHRHIQK